METWGEVSPGLFLYCYLFLECLALVLCCPTRLWLLGGNGERGWGCEGGIEMIGDYYKESVDVIRFPICRRLPGVHYLNSNLVSCAALNHSANSIEF